MTTKPAVEGYLLDTNVAVEATYERAGRQGSVLAWLKSIGRSPVCLSTVTLGEMAQGIEIFRLKNPTVTQANLMRLVDDIRSMTEEFHVLEVGNDAANVWGELRANLFYTYAPTLFENSMKKRRVASLKNEVTDEQLGIQENDLWIVSVARAHNLTFVTMDRAEPMKRIVGVAGYTQRTIFL